MIFHFLMAQNRDWYITESDPIDTMDGLDLLRNNSFVCRWLHNVIISIFGSLRCPAISWLLLLMLMLLFW